MKRFLKVARGLLAVTFVCCSILFFAGFTMKEGNFERVNGSFRADFTGRVMTTAPEAVLIKDRTGFAAYLSNPMRFFDGRFMRYENYEGNNFFEKYDLVAIIVQGEAALVSFERGGGEWLVSLEVEEGRHALYFLTVPKDDAMTGARLI